MALVRWDPFSELNNLHEQVNSLFSDTFGGTQTHDAVTLPVTDVYSNKDALTIEAHLPNFSENEISIEQNDNDLEIRAEHQEKEQSDDRKYLIRESVSRYYRRFTLPTNSDRDDIHAHYENGILKLTVPFRELPQPKRITIGTKVDSTSPKK